MHKWSYIFLNNILNNIIKKRKRDCHPSMKKQLYNGFQTAHMFYLSHNFDKYDEKTSLTLFCILQTNKFYSSWKLSK